MRGAFGLRMPGRTPNEGPHHAPTLRVSLLSRADNRLLALGHVAG